MAHHDGRIPGDPKVQGMGGSRVLVDVECASRVIGDPGSIGSSFLTEFCQGPNDPDLLSAGERVVIVDESKQAAHFKNPPRS